MRNWLFIKYPKCEIGFLLYNQNAGKMENWLFINKLDNCYLVNKQKWTIKNPKLYKNGYLIQKWLFTKFGLSKWPRGPFSIPLISHNDLQTSVPTWLLPLPSFSSYLFHLPSSTVIFLHLLSFSSVHLHSLSLIFISVIYLHLF